jgi:hypothetical protein
MLSIILMCRAFYDDEALDVMGGSICGEQMDF